MSAYRSFFAATLALTFLTGMPLGARAQETAPTQVPTAPPGMARLQTQLDHLRYDAAEHGPLVVVVPPALLQGFTPIKRPLPGLTEPGPTPLMLAEAFDQRVVRAGNLMIIAPRTMTIINAHPGKPNPYGNMRPEERLRMLMGTLTQAQWERAGSTGIGLSDLTREQAELMEGAFPKIHSVRPMKVVVKPETPNESRYESDGEVVQVEPRQMRLRLARAASYTWQRDGQEGNRYGSGTYRSPANGARIWLPAYEQNDDDETRRKQAYGVTLISVVPAQLKPSELDFASPALNAAVPLENSSNGTERPLQTIGELLKQIGTATGLELRADPRIAGLPVWVRSAPGQSARAGDLLMALSLGVTGAYRRLEPRLFLLTDDMEGLGTRFARLQAWVDEASYARQELLRKALTQAAKQDPLRYLNFAPGQVAFPPALTAQIQSSWKHYPLPSISLSSLPPEVQKDVEEQRQTWEHMQEPVYLSKDKVELNMELKAQWVLPNGGTVQDYDQLNIMGGNSLSFLEPELKSPSPEPTPTKPATLVSPFLTVGATRRVIVLSPATADQTRQLMQAALARGFNEFWIYQTLARKDDAPLRAALAWGKNHHVKVGAATSLLRNAGVGAPERTILGQTGQEWADAYINRPMYTTLHPEMRYDAEWQSARYLGWSDPETDDEQDALEARLLQLAKMPGLAGLCIKDSFSPGAGGDLSESDGTMSGGDMGYTLPKRTAMLRQNGYDPIDIIPNMWSLTVDKSLPFFPYEQGRRYKEVAGKYVIDTAFVAPPALWKQFRNEQERGRMAQLYRKLRAASPTLPLYVDDGISAYASANTSWFGSWDAPDRLPKNPVYSSDSDANQAARAASDTRLARCAWDRVSGKTQELEWFNGSITRTYKRAEKPALPWHGIAVDLSNLDAKDTLHMLAALPPLTPATKP